MLAAQRCVKRALTNIADLNWEQAKELFETFCKNSMKIESKLKFIIVAILENNHRSIYDWRYGSYWYEMKK